MATEKKLTNLPSMLLRIETMCQELKDQTLSDFREYINLENWRPKKTKEYPKVGELKHAGVYCIYEGQEIIYIGSAGSRHTLRNRIGNLFVHRSQKNPEFGHNLTHKLILDKTLRRFSKIDEVRDFYLNCRFKFITANNDAEAHALENVLIMLFTPEYNNETRKR